MKTKALLLLLAMLVMLFVAVKAQTLTEAKGRTIEVSAGTNISSRVECNTDSDCSVAGCNGEICAPKDVAKNIVTPCVYEDWYSCFKLTRCVCYQGVCTWEPNPDFEECLKKYGRELPKLIRHRASEETNASQILNMTPYPHLYRIAECIKEKRAEGLNQEEAVLACKLEKWVKPELLGNKCSEIRDMMTNISEEIARDPSKAEEYIPMLLNLRAQYKHCLIVQPTGPALPSDKCKQYAVFKQWLEESKGKLEMLEELKEVGQLNESDLKRFEEQVEFLEERTEDLKRLCEMKEAEPPCKELYALIRVRDHLLNLMQLSNETEAVGLNKSIAEITARIDELKEKCAAVPIEEQAKEAKSLEDLSELYRAKAEEIAENVTLQAVTKEEIAKGLKQLEEERKELIRSFVTRMKEINLEKQELIHRLRVGEEVEVEGVRANISKINIVIDNQTVSIVPGKKVKIVVGNEEAEANIELELQNNTLIDPTTNKTIKVLPNQLKEKLKKGAIREAILERTRDKLVYKVQAAEQGKLLGFIPVTITVRHEVDASTGNIEVTVKPWWSFLVFG